jgi:ABC-type multidrug transport system fused ATPase/permease subunit
VLSKKYLDELAKANASATETITNIRTVRYFAGEKNDSKQYSIEINKTLTLGNKLAIYRGAYYSSIFTITNMIVVSILYIGGIDIISGLITSGELTSFLIYCIYVGASFTSLSSLYTDIMKVLGSSERVFEILDREPELKNTSTIIDQPIGKIEFRNVIFSYPTRVDNNILNDFSLIIEPGKKIALVGI